MHVFSHRTFEHEHGPHVRAELVGATKQFDAMVDALRRDKNVVSIITE